MPLWMWACIIMTVVIVLIACLSKKLPAPDPMLNHTAPRFTFADSDISDTIETLLGRPGVVSMSAKEGQELAVKVNPYRTDAGESYTTTGPATIIIVPEDV